MLTCGLLGLHDGSDVLLVGSLLGASLGVLILLSGESANLAHISRLFRSTYDVAQLLLGCLTGVLTLVTTGHLGLKGSRELARKKVLVFWCRFLVRNCLRGETEADRGCVYASCWCWSRKGKGRESKHKARAIFCQRAEAEIPKQPSVPQPGSSFHSSGSSRTCWLSDKRGAHVHFHSLPLALLRYISKRLHEIP